MNQVLGLMFVGRAATSMQMWLVRLRCIFCLASCEYDGNSCHSLLQEYSKKEKNGLHLSSWKSLVFLNVNREQVPIVGSSEFEVCRWPRTNFPCELVG